MKRATSALATMMGALLAGVSLLLLNMQEWSSNENLFAFVASSSRSSLILNFFLVEALALVLICVSVSLILRNVAEGELSADRIDLRLLISRALSSKASARVGVLFGVVYGVIYAFASSTVVFQPGTDFGATYGVTEPGWVGIGCCGVFGTVPKVILFPPPAFHLGIQLVPLTALFLAIVPFLVGFNFTVVSYAFSSRVGGGGVASWLTSIGASVGLFTACPTCAGLFLAGAIGGLGATSLAVSLAPYQILFVTVSIPVLLLTPVAVASTMRRYLNTSCIIK